MFGTPNGTFPAKSLIVVLLTVWCAHICNAGMAQFLRDAIYSIQSSGDRGYLTIRDSPAFTYKIIQPEPWANLKEQKWMVFDQDDIGLYDFTPVLFNTTDNVVTYEATKNAYTYKRQWNVTFATPDKYTIRNPESGWCLTSDGTYKEVTEKPCNSRLPLSQLWKFRMLRPA